MWEACLCHNYVMPGSLPTDSESGGKAMLQEKKLSALSASPFFQFVTDRIYTDLRVYAIHGDISILRGATISACENANRWLWAVRSFLPQISTTGCMESMKLPLASTMRLSSMRSSSLYLKAATAERRGSKVDPGYLHLQISNCHIRLVFLKRFRS